MATGDAGGVSIIVPPILMSSLSARTACLAGQGLSVLGSPMTPLHASFENRTELDLKQMYYLTTACRPVSQVRHLQRKWVEVRHLSPPKDFTWDQGNNDYSLTPCLRLLANHASYPPLDRHWGHPGASPVHRVHHQGPSVHGLHGRR